MKENIKLLLIGLGLFFTTSCNTIAISDKLYMGMSIQAYTDVIEPCTKYDLTYGRRSTGKQCVTLGTGHKMEANPDFCNKKLCGLDLKLIDFSTETAQNIFNYLTTKYGKPTQSDFKKENVLNLFESYSIEASWKLNSGLKIEYKGWTTKNESICNIEFSTSSEFRDSQFDKNKSKPQL